MFCLVTLKRALLLAGASLCLAVPLWAADPGIDPPPTSDFSAQKIGSVLVFPYYSSSVGAPNTQNTRFAVTNHSLDTLVTLHLFFVSNSVADSYICLTASQTASFLVSDIDPGITGFMVAVAVDTNGAPINFNFLTGEADVKLNTGQRASLKAEAIAAISLPAFGGLTATLNFDGTAYNRLPRALAMDKFKSRADGNSTLLVVERISGNYVTGNIDSIGAGSGNLCNDAANAFPFTFNGGVQLVQTLSNTFPLTNPVFDTVVPAGHTGWLYLAANADVGLFGAVFNFNPNAATQAGDFTGGHNLRALSLSTTNSIIIPIFPPSC